MEEKPPASVHPRAKTPLLTEGDALVTPFTTFDEFVGNVSGLPESENVARLTVKTKAPELVAVEKYPRVLAASNVQPKTGPLEALRDKVELVKLLSATLMTCAPLAPR